MEKWRIKLLNNIAKKGLDRFDKNLYDVSKEIIDEHALLVRSAKILPENLSSELLAIGRAGIGVNNIPIEVCSEKNIVVFNTPGANANAVKELVLAGLFLASRDIVGGISFAQSLKGQGDKVKKMIEANKSNYAGNEIKTKKLGVIGLGAIGMMIANDAVALGMEVQGYDPFISVDRAWELSRGVKPAKNLEKLLATCDYISFNIPLNDKNKRFYNEDLIYKTKKGAVILNFARGELVDEDALIKALDEDHLKSYVTDFPTDKLLGNSKIITIPHLGASTSEAEDICANMVVDQIMDYLERGNIKNSVNFPECYLDWKGDTRILITNKNIPNVIGRLATILADKGINILDMINKSKGNIAYNIVDIQGKVTSEQIKDISQVEGVSQVRVIDSI